MQSIGISKWVHLPFTELNDWCACRQSEDIFNLIGTLLPIACYEILGDITTDKVNSHKNVF